MEEDLFKNPFKTELYEFDGGEEPPPVPVGFFGVGHVRRNANGPVRIVGTTSPKFHKPRMSLPSHIKTIDQAHRWMEENGVQGTPRKRVTVRDISTSHSGGGPLEEHIITPLAQLPNGVYVAPHQSLRKMNLIKRMINANGDDVFFVHPHAFNKHYSEYSLAEARIRDWNGRLVDTDIGGYYHPDNGQWVPHKPASGGWTRHDSGIRPSRSPVNKSQYPRASTILDPQNAEIFRQKEEALRKKEEARELRRIETEQRNVLRARRIAKQEQELDSPTQPKPRGRPPKKTGWF